MAEEKEGGEERRGGEERGEKRKDQSITMEQLAHFELLFYIQPTKVFSVPWNSFPLGLGAHQDVLD